MSANICGNRLKDLRESRGWGQIEVAAALNVDYRLKIEQSDVSEIERGIRGVKDYELKAFAEIFGVSADWLLEDFSNEQ